MKVTTITRSGRFVGKDMRWTADEIEEIDLDGKKLQVVIGECRYEISERDGRLKIWELGARTLWAHNMGGGNVLEILAQPLFTTAMFFKEEK